MGFKGSLGKSDASAEAVFLDFHFAGELIADSCWGPERKIEDQMLYTIGHLNGEKSVGRLDQIALTDVATQDVDGGCLVTYSARLPVAWGKKSSVPATYELMLPRFVSYGGQQAFTEKYNHTCVDPGAHDVTSGSMWYYYRPNRSGCTLADEDIVAALATVSPSPIQTTGKFPEYHKVWEDGALKVVAVFGKYEDGATSGDAGISAYSKFVKAVDTLARTWPGATNIVSTPETLPSTAGVETPDVSFTAELPGGRVLEVTALLVDDIKTAGSTFNARYETLTPDADLIVYNGHAGLGANVKAIATKGQWVTGQYAIVFVNGCDTFAYIDSALADAHSEINDDDPHGTKYVDIVTNAMPSFFSSMSNATMSIMKGLLDYEQPRTYEQIFTNIDSAEVVLVSGEQDNVYVPGYTEDPTDDPTPVSWVGLDESGDVSRGEELHFSTPTLATGTYRFELSGTEDADLYVRLGKAPTMDIFDCRPWSVGSAETCEVEVTTPTTVHVMVTAWSEQATFGLIGASAADL